MFTLDVTTPLPTGAHHAWHQACLHHHLPALALGGAGSGATNRIASLMANMLTEQQATRTNAADARTCALTPKMVSEYFKPYMMNKLMELCGVTMEASLPGLWSTLAAQNGKRECVMINNLI